jgi:tripartite-type tricarboxylate transporter receptor subunit TctC
MRHRTMTTIFRKLAAITNHLASAVLGLGLLSAFLGQANAQEVAWPKQTSIVVPFPPGASNDIFARILAQKLGPRLGTTIVVDNKPGAGGAIGAAYVAKSTANGATLMLTSSTFTGNAAVQPTLPFDPIAGFVPVAQLAKGPMILAVGLNTPFHATAELLAAARAESGKLNFGTAGIGSVNHMANELLNSMAKVEMTHVRYRGISNAITDLMGGQIHVVIASFPSIFGLLKGGQVRGLAVTSAERSPFAPELPTIADTVPGYAVELWWGVFAPAGTPGPMVARLNTEIRAIISEPEMRERFAKEGALPSPIAAAEFAAIVRSDLNMWRKIAEERHITAE